MNTRVLLEDKFGPLMSSRDVQHTLRFTTNESFRVARNRGYLKLRMFAMPGRRGLFAKTEEVAHLIEIAADDLRRNDM